MLKSLAINFKVLLVMLMISAMNSCDTGKKSKTQPNLFVQVVNENDKPKDFSYTIQKSADSSNVKSGTATGQAALMVPENTSYTIQVSTGSYVEIKRNVKWPANTAKIIRFEFNDEEGEYVLDADENIPLDQIDENGVTKAEKEMEANKKIPAGWVEGKFYNSNNVSCPYAGQSLVFVNQGSEILNLKTGKYSEGVVVEAGKGLAVAVSSNGGFMRAFLSTDPGNSASRGRSISFVSLENLYKGWWFAAGCEDGSKPATNCNDGNGLTDYGGACKTLGEDY